MEVRDAADALPTVAILASPSPRAAASSSAKEMEMTRPSTPAFSSSLMMSSMEEAGMEEAEPRRHSSSTMVGGREKWGDFEILNTHCTALHCIQ
jgi:hypothetical protein